jgi:CHAT domain-containing protein
LLLLIITCGIACRRQENPQVAFGHAYKAFLRGDLKLSQEEADREYQRLRNSNSQWSWKFRILEAQSLLWRGMYQQVLTLLSSPPDRPDDRQSWLEVLALEGTARARLHDFPAAEAKLGQAIEACQIFHEATCGDVIRAQGILAIQRGQVDSARNYFERSLQFARAHNDRFLEVTALLNLGLASLQAQHFDEAIDWTDAAYQASTALGANGEAQTALGNLGWAYYNLGDSERSLELSLEAARRAGEMGRIIGELSWITNAGYVYARRGDFGRAKQSYLMALDLATKIGGREDIYNALRALALVSVGSGTVAQASKYSDDAIAIARADNNRLDELYPLLVKGLVAARFHDVAEAERIFHEVEHDNHVNASLKWRSEHALARLYDDEQRPEDADRAYRAALATFEAARSSLQRNDAKLPFSNNASHIYDDYIHFLVARGKLDEALRWADYSRARTLADGLQGPTKGIPSGSMASSTVPNPTDVAQRVRGVILFYWLGEKQSYLWAITPKKASLYPLPLGSEIDAAVQRYRKALGGPQDVLESADHDGRYLYDTLIAPARALLPQNAKIFIVPDGNLNNLNFETLLVSEPKLHYWIEDATIANASSLRLLSASSSSPVAAKATRKLLLMGNSIAPNDRYPELPRASSQMDRVAAHFSPNEREILARNQATPAAYFSSDPGQFAYIHFVAHGTASRLSPLDSAIVLSKSSAEDDSFKLYARDIVRRPLQAQLVTISSCYGAGERAYSGEGLVGLSWAFLRAGAHHVIAALWEATDASTEQLMGKFYEEIEQGRSPDTALRTAKLALLHGSAFHNPFYWAPFQLYVGSRVGSTANVRVAQAGKHGPSS